MKKVIAILLTVLLLATSVMADVLTEVKDDFWKDHYRECENIYRQYTANGKDGFVTLYESPTSKKERENVKNGETLDGQWLYTDGNGAVWLAVYDGYEEGYNLCRGWVRVADCAAVPDYVMFEENYSAEFTEWDPAYNDAFDGVTELVLWEYPCAAQAKDWRLPVDTGMKPSEVFVSYYTDDAGRYWGFSGYFRGRNNAWVCLSDPMNAELPANSDVFPTQDILIPAAETVPSPGSGISTTTVVLVAAVLLVTAALISFLFRKKQGKNGN